MTPQDRLMPERWKPNPITPPEHLHSTRNIGHARRAAVRRLIAAHPEQFQALYEEEATARGITVRRGKPAKRSRKAA